MDKTHFDQLVAGVKEMKRHMAGKAVRGARVTEIAEPDVNVRAIREAASISQSQFAKLIERVHGGTRIYHHRSRWQNVRHRSVHPKNLHL